MNILDLRAKHAALWEQTKNFLEDHRDERGLVSSEDVAVYENMVKDVKALSDQIKMLEDQAVMDQSFNQPTSTPIVNDPASTSIDNKSEYAKAFWDYIRFSTPIKNALAEGQGPTGGYTVPDEFEKTLVQKLTEQNVVRRIAHVIRTNSGSTSIPVANGDITAAWTNEAAAISETNETFSQVVLSAHKLASRLKISNELLADSAFNLAQYVAQQFGIAFGEKEEEAFLNGSGENQPKGIFTIADDEAAVRVGAYTGGGNAASITFDSIFQLYYSLKAPYRSNAAWLVSEEVMLALMTLKDSSGAYLWKPSLDQGKPDTLLGKPIYTSSFVPTPGDLTKKDIAAFGDFSKYWIADRGNRTFKRLNELYAETDQTGFVATQRVDGAVVLPEAIKVLRTGTAPAG